MSETQTSLYDLLPAIYRERDAAQGEPLRRLLGIIDAQAAKLRADIAQLYDDLFAETCAPWVLPYIGDLVGNGPLFGAEEVLAPDTAVRRFPDLRGPSLAPSVGVRRRADVVKTIYYRRRKGTPPMLEELAHDVTGWAAHLVEFFSVLGWTQMIRNHTRPDAVWADLRSPVRCDLVRGPFDPFLHSVDVRPISSLDGWHRIPNLGFFVWRLGSVEIAGMDARRDPGRTFGWHASPLGQAAPLFAAWRREGDEAGMTQERHRARPDPQGGVLRRSASRQGAVPGAGDDGLLRHAAHGPDGPRAGCQPVFDPVAWRRALAGADRSNRLRQSAELRSAGARQGRAVDVALGRIALGAALPGQVGTDADRVAIACHYGFPAALGGGPYERRAWTIRRDALTGETLPPVVIRVRQDGAGDHATIGAALTAWAGAVPPRPDAIITIEDSRTYAEDLTIELADGGRLAIEAANGARPHLLGNIDIIGVHDDAALTLSGLLIEGVVNVTGALGQLRILHSTLVPGPTLLGTGPESGPPAIQPSLEVAAGAAPDRLNKALEVDLAFSITGPLRIPVYAKALRVLDSIIVADPDADAIGMETGLGPPTAMERVTILGRVWVEALTLASEVIFEGAVYAARRQIGCIRFNYVPPGGRTPRRYRCQPDLRIQTEAEAREAATGIPISDADRQIIAARVARWLVPSWTSRRYGQPAFPQLHVNAPIEISAGAEDGAEKGAFCHLKQPQRAANLRQRLDEYLPFGLDAGLIPVT